jgi:DNA-binding PadR family transcriptional regulator
MALGILARSGPSHGHHIRRVAEVTNVGEWGGVSVGALYRELRAMEREGLVAAARTEKVGNRPERTVYEITAEGHLELTTLREQAIRPLGSGPDPIGVALLFTADGLDRAELRRTLRARREKLAIEVAEVAAERERLVADGLFDVLAAAVMRRGIVHIEAEIRWHDELDATLAGPGGGEGPVGLHSGGSFEVAALRKTAFEIVAGDISGSSADGVPDAAPSAGGLQDGSPPASRKSR